jgi:hypothetical protein
VEVLRRRHLEVVGAGHGQVDLGRAGEPRHRHAHLRPQERPQRVPPPRRLPEQLEEPRRLGGVVAAALRLDHELATERNGVDRLAVGLGQPQAEEERR